MENGEECGERTWENDYARAPIRDAMTKTKIDWIKIRKRKGR